MVRQDIRSLQGYLRRITLSPRTLSKIPYFNEHLTKTLKHYSLIAFAALSLIVSLGLATRGQASATTATVAGAVRDATGAALPGATVTLRDPVTNQTRRVVTEANGSYRAAALPVGDYELRVEAVGFASYVNRSVTLALGNTVTLDITMHPSGV